MKLGEVYTFNNGKTFDVICRINKLPRNGKEYWYQIFDKKGEFVDLECMDDEKWEACAFACHDEYKLLGEMNKEYGLDKELNLTRNKRKFAYEWKPK